MTIKNKLIILLPIFIIVIFIANFALAEDDDDDEYESGGEDDYVPTIIQPIPAPVLKQITQPISTVTIQEIPVNILIDSDSDGIIDSLDKYPGEDDFSFNVLDANKNGIIDELEYLLNL